MHEAACKIAITATYSETSKSDVPKTLFLIMMFCFGVLSVNLTNCSPKVQPLFIAVRQVLHGSRQKDPRLFSSIA